MGCPSAYPPIKHRSLTLLLLVCALSPYCTNLTCANPTFRHDIDCDNLVPGDIPTPHPSAMPVKLVFKLQNTCSNGYVRITDNHKVKADAGRDDQFNGILITSVGHCSVVLIQSNRTKTYMCMNRHGRLIARHSIHKKSEYCKFQERLTDSGHSEFTSIKNATWKIGFRVSGKPLHGDHRRKHRRFRSCYKFSKINTRETPTWSPLNTAVGRNPDFFERYLQRNRHRHGHNGGRGR